MNRPRRWWRGENRSRNVKRPLRWPCAFTCWKRRWLGTRASWKPVASFVTAETKRTNFYFAMAVTRAITLTASNLPWTTSPTAIGSVTNAEIRRLDRGIASYAANRAAKIAGCSVISVPKRTTSIVCNHLWPRYVADVHLWWMTADEMNCDSGASREMELRFVSANRMPHPPAALRTMKRWKLRPLSPTARVPLLLRRPGARPRRWPTSEVLKRPSQRTRT